MIPLPPLSARRPPGLFCTVAGILLLCIFASVAMAQGVSPNRAAADRAFEAEQFADARRL